MVKKITYIMAGSLSAVGSPADEVGDSCFYMTCFVAM